MSAQKNSIYLERRTYRRRRLQDAARLLPVLGVLLFLVPLLWATRTEEPASTASGGIYVFGIWAGLIVASAWLSRRLGGEQTDLSGGDRSP